ncbi:hypothetical protein [Pedobacter glucosidilyticus]|uniref:hypothetical protein n=1 Tax=Pedobacter glucosidilyticus TaxID=1122941 RepID=UPI000406FD2C|nr:hypothetical protein [Pedobacter glucosidilyticus]
MDLQTRKIEFVKEFLSLQNEELISSLENLLKGEKKAAPMSLTKLNKRINTSMTDSENDSVIKAENLISEIQKW